MSEQLGLTLDEWKYLDESAISSGKIKSIGVNHENGEKYVRLEYTIPSKEDRDKAAYDAAISSMKVYLASMRYEQEIFEQVRKAQPKKEPWYVRAWQWMKGYFK